MEYTALKDAFQEWLGFEDLFDPELGTRELSKFKELNDLPDADIGNLEFGLKISRERLIPAANRFGRLVRQSKLQLVVSKKPDEASKIRLDPFVWPEGPFCSPLALHERIRNHRSSNPDSRSDTMKNLLELYDGYFVFLETEKFRHWLNHGLQELPKLDRVGGLVAPEVEALLQRVILEKAELEDAYRKRVQDWSNEDPPPSVGDDWQFLRNLDPRLPRSRAEAIRRKWAPEAWKLGGPRHPRKEKQ